MASGCRPGAVRRRTAAYRFPQSGWTTHRLWWPWGGRSDDRHRVGDQWTFVAIDADTKLIPTWLVGKRSRENANALMLDLSMRLANRVQLSTDAMDAYENAVEEAFGADVDYGQAVKFYEAEPIGPGRYSPPKVVDMERSVLQGSPEPRHISTSIIERQNLTMRMAGRGGSRRLRRPAALRAWPPKNRSKLGRYRVVS